MSRVFAACVAICLAASPVLAASPKIESAIKTFKAVAADSNKLKTFCAMTKVMDAAGENTVVWASDFPHYDCSLPGLADEMRDRNDLSAQRMKKVAVTNALEFFDIQLPKAKPAAVATRAGRESTAAAAAV